ncbi:D-alanyl-D-alanine carboxypeptidase family protein [Paenibacillus sp. DYY-L-2]|uniref:M15 family metallopeptidase n=1 Tax=Paenibacillus sp. DYY-L-2 TaxID=3447013 RepID=UPI003F50727A
MKQRKGRRVLPVAVILLMSVFLFTACGGNKANETQAPDQTGTAGNETAVETNAGAGTDSGSNAGAETGGNTGSASDDNNGTNQNPDGTSGGNGNNSASTDQPDRTAAQNAESVAVLVNKEFALPDDYEPDDLVYPDVRFTFKDKIDKRKMRKEAAEALEQLFAGAEKDGIYLAGVSAYRSHSTQTSLFNRYVERDGLEKAKTYSAEPGHSEHETGLAIDVSGSDGKCAAEDCFGGTPEAEWLADHASDYGFIIRYPDGKEDITGYKYEPWHLRYVGKAIAADIAERGITLEEYYDAVPVSVNTP